MDTLGKRDVAEVIAVELYGQDATVAQVNATEDAVNALLEFIEDGFVKNYKTRFKNFGSLVPKFKAARIGRNPKTLEPFEIPARVTVTYLPRAYTDDHTSGKIGVCDMKEEMRKHFNTVLEAERFIDHFNALLVNAVYNDMRFEFRGFGSFNHKFKEGRHTHNPKTGEPIWVEDKTVLHFKVSKQLVKRLTKKMM